MKGTRGSRPGVRFAGPARMCPDGIKDIAMVMNIFLNVIKISFLRCNFGGWYLEYWSQLRATAVFGLVVGSV